MSLPGLPGGAGPPPGPVSAEYARARVMGAGAQHRLPSPEVLRGIDDERRLRRLRRFLRVSRWLRRVR